MLLRWFRVAQIPLIWKPVVDFSPTIQLHMPRQHAAGADQKKMSLAWRVLSSNFLRFGQLFVEAILIACQLLFILARPGSVIDEAQGPAMTRTGVGVGAMDGKGVMDEQIPRFGRNRNLTGAVGIIIVRDSL